VPLILVIAIVGSYAVSGRIGDSVATVLFGLLGYVCFKYNYSRVNLIIGLALGPILESNLHISTQLYGNDFLLHRPVAGGLAAVVLATVMWWVWSRRMARRDEARVKLSMGETPETGAAPTRAAVATAIGFVVVFAVAAGVGLTYGPLTGRILTLVSALCLLLAVANAVGLTRARLTGVDGVETMGDSADSAAVHLGAGEAASHQTNVSVMEHPGSVSGTPGAGASRAGVPRLDVGPAGGQDGGVPAESEGESVARASGGNLVELALQRRISRESSATKVRGYELSSVAIVLGFLGVVLLLGLTLGVGVAMALFRFFAAPTRGWRTTLTAVLWGVGVSAVTWLLFNTLVNQFIPYTGPFLGG